MKFIIALVAALACAYAQTAVQPNGFLYDTPEVAQAKAAHFAEHARAAYAAGSPSYYKTYSPIPYSYAPAAITVLPNGYLADTPEVAQAKSVHFAEHAKASNAAVSPIIPSISYKTVSYAAPFAHTLAPITVLPSGYLADTPDVASARAAHLAEHARAAYAAGSPSYNSDYYKTYSPISYSYAPAAITVLPNGYLADTPEVAQAKSAHFAEHAKSSNAAVSPIIPSTSYKTESYAAPFAYTSAPITVLPSGYLADTPDVASARAAHLAEHARVVAASGAGSNPYYSDYYTWNGFAWVAKQ